MLPNTLAPEQTEHLEIPMRLDKFASLQDFIVYSYETIDRLLSGVETGSVPIGGMTGQLLAKASDSDGDTEWISAGAIDGLPTGGTDGQVLIKQSDTDGDAAWEDPVGADGKSAYEVAVDEGFVGSASAWLATLVGPQGPQGPQGATGATGATGNTGSQGVQGNPGNDGKSAYDVAVDNGFPGNQSSWLASLIGPQGETGAEGPAGTGSDGKSAYEVALDFGFVGDEEAWLDSLQGSGKSAYETAVDEGFVGDAAAWLASLVGAEGPKGDTGDTGPAGADGPTGPPGAGLSVDEYGVLDEAKITEIETADVDWWFLVNPAGDTRVDKNTPASIDGDMSLHLIQFRTSDNTWHDFGQFTGVAGPAGATGSTGATGDTGPAGKSAYDVAVDEGFGGDEAAWLASLVGAAGTDGDDGAPGNDGDPGKSAYEIAVIEGFVGDVTAWLASLVGAEGPKGDTGDTGATGSTGSAGSTGISAYQAAVDGGFIGTQPEWLASLEGDSAYEIALDEGFVGDVTAWLASLVGPEGPQGDPGDTGATGADGAAPAMTLKSNNNTTYTFGLTDADKFNHFTNAGTKSVTVPPNSTTAFPFTADGATTTIFVMNQGAGLMTLVAGAGVTINVNPLLSLTIAQWGSAVLTKIGTDTWYLTGDLEPA